MSTPENKWMRRQTQKYVNAVYKAHPELKQLQPAYRRREAPVPLFKPKQNPYPTPRTMREAMMHIAFKYDVTVDELKSRSRKKYLIAPRVEFAEICKGLGKSLEEIGNSLGRDHSTIHHYLCVLSTRDEERIAA